MRVNKWEAKWRQRSVRNGKKEKSELVIGSGGKNVCTNLWVVSLSFTNISQTSGSIFCRKIILLFKKMLLVQATWWPSCPDLLGSPGGGGWWVLKIIISMNGWFEIRTKDLGRWWCKIFRVLHDLFAWMGDLRYPVGHPSK